MNSPPTPLASRRYWLPRVAVSATLLVFFLLAWRGLRLVVVGGSARTVMQTVESPDHQLIAYVVAVGQGGATVGYSYEVVVLPVSAQLAGAAANSWIWRSYRVPPEAISWTKRNELRVRVAQGNFRHYERQVETRQRLGVSVSTEVE